MSSSTLTKRGKIRTNRNQHLEGICVPSAVQSASLSVVLSSLWLHGLYSPWNSPGQNTGVGSLSLLQGIFPTQGSNPGLWHCRRILFQLSHRESPRTLEWVAHPFSSRSSWPRNQTGVSFIAGRFFTNWAIREAPKSNIKYPMGVNIFIYAENILYETYGERHKNNLKLDSKYVKLNTIFSLYFIIHKINYKVYKKYLQLWTIWRSYNH